MPHERISILFIVFLIFAVAPARGDNADDPCGGENFLLSLVDRPTVGDSACVVPFKKTVLEVGYEYQKLKQSGHVNNFPEAEIRIGLPYDTEYVLVAPNFIEQSIPLSSGLSATVTGIKHRLSYGSKWVLTVEGLITLPSGSEDFGSKNYGVAFNGIYNYNYTSKFSVATMLGVTSQSQSSSDGGKRFYSINPDVVITWAPSEKFNLYAEFYAQTKTSPDEKLGVNFDGGLLYLLAQNLTVDMEVGHRISGNLGSFDRYIGAGFSIIF